MTMTHKLRVEHGRAPRSPGLPRGHRRRTRRAHDPSRLCRRSDRRGGDAQQKSRDARRLRGHRQPAAGDEIEHFRLAPEFDHHRAQCIAGQCIGRDAQDRFDVSRAHCHDLTRVKAEFAPATHRQSAGFHFCKILPHPEQRSFRDDTLRQSGDETRRCGNVAAVSGINFMECAAQQPAPKRHIGTGMAERDSLRHADGLRRVEMGDVVAQTRERI